MKALGLLAALTPGATLAHSFGQTYTLPVPVWLYLYGAAAALIVSFVIVGYFVRSNSVEANQRSIKLSKFGLPNRHVIAALRCASVALLLLVIIAGFIGVNHPYRNINMTLFWVIFCLGFTYLIALIGDWYAALNPFRVIADWLERIAPGRLAGHYAYPENLSYWPALTFYAAFIWLELFGRSTPHSLAVTLSSYLLINLLGCWLIGKRAWFEHCEFFGVFLRLVARLSPLDVHTQHGTITGLTLRQPCAGLLQTEKIPLSLLTFILFMLSSTAFDGLHETALWVGAFWENLYQYVLIPIYGNAPPVTFESIKKIFLGYQSSALLISPFVYLAVYALFLLAAKTITRSGLSLKPLLAWFGYSLIPIAFAYHLTHYYTLLQVQGVQIVRLISDPFGWGWNLFGTAKTPINIIPDMGFVWHTQVFIIIAGHVISVYLAHQQALRVFPDRRSAVLSQLPVLVLMVGFTTAGLWILSLPHSSGVVGS